MDIKTKIVGVTFGDCQENIKTLSAPTFDAYELVREPFNPHDQNAIRVCAGPHKMGYIPAHVAKTVAPVMDSGKKLIAQFHSLNRSPYHVTVGMNITIVEVEPEFRFEWQ